MVEWILGCQDPRILRHPKIWTVDYPNGEVFNYQLSICSIIGYPEYSKSGNHGSVYNDGNFFVFRAIFNSWKENHSFNVQVSSFFTTYPPSANTWLWLVEAKVPEDCHSKKWRHQTLNSELDETWKPCVFLANKNRLFQSGNSGLG